MSHAEMGPGEALDSDGESAGEEQRVKVDKKVLRDEGQKKYLGEPNASHDNFVVLVYPLEKRIPASKGGS